MTQVYRGQVLRRRGRSEAVTSSAAASTGVVSRVERKQLANAAGGHPIWQVVPPDQCIPSDLSISDGFSDRPSPDRPDLVTVQIHVVPNSRHFAEPSGAPVEVLFALCRPVNRTFAAGWSGVCAATTVASVDGCDLSSCGRAGDQSRGDLSGTGEPKSSSSCLFRRRLSGTRLARVEPGDIIRGPEPRKGARARTSARSGGGR